MELFPGVNRLVCMLEKLDHTADKLPALLKKLRLERRISQLQLADEAGVNVSVVHRTELGSDARLSTWKKLFDGLGYRLLIDAYELAEECGDVLSEESERRQDRRLEGLCTGKRRY